MSLHQRIKTHHGDDELPKTPSHIGRHGNPIEKSVGKNNPEKKTKPPPRNEFGSHVKIIEEGPSEDVFYLRSSEISYSVKHPFGRMSKEFNLHRGRNGMKNEDGPHYGSKLRLKLNLDLVPQAPLDPFASPTNKSQKSTRATRTDSIKDSNHDLQL